MEYYRYSLSTVGTFVITYIKVKIESKVTHCLNVCNLCEFATKKCTPMSDSPDACHIKWPYSGKETKLRETINNYFLVLSYRQQLRKKHV